MFCKNVARLVVARGCHTWIRSLAMAKQAIFLQNILWQSYRKFNFKQYLLKKIYQIIDTLARIHGNVFPWQPSIMGNKSLFY